MTKREVDALILLARVHGHPTDMLEFISNSFDGPSTAYAELILTDNEKEKKQVIH